MNIVTIMNFKPDANHFQKMCYVWLKRVLKHVPPDAKIHIFYKNHKPAILKYFKAYENRIKLIKGESVKANHHNLAFKLNNLANLNMEYIFLDADMYVIKDLSPLWELRKDKPWIGVNHQWIPGHADTHRKPFLNSGLQIVSDPKFYDYNKIRSCMNKIRWVPGTDQSALHNYFLSIKYDYTHPKVGPEWNSCAKVGQLKHEGGDDWSGHTKGLSKDHPVYINHYWWEYKPWLINCPLHNKYKL